MLAEIGVVLGISTMRVDHRLRHVAVSLIAQISARDAWILGIRIGFVGVLAETRKKMARARHFERNLTRRRIEHVVFVNRDVLKPLLAPLIGHPSSELVVPRRACGRRLRRKIAMKLCDLFPGSKRLKLVFNSALFFGSARRISEHGLRSLRSRNSCTGQKQKNGRKHNRSGAAAVREAQKNLRCWRGAFFRDPPLRDRVPQPAFESWTA